MLKSATTAVLLAQAQAIALSGCADEQLNPVRFGWSQWGQGAEHTGQVSVAGQRLDRILAEIPMDPFVHHERTEAGYEEHGVGPLLIHYQAPLVDEDDVFISSKGGAYVPCVPAGSGQPSPCGVDAWDQQIWREGHLFHFDRDGGLRGTYDFGWDVTPGIYARPGSYSIVIKENQYNTGSYCNEGDFCPPAPGGPFNITQLSPDLDVEWTYTLTNQESCVRQEDGSVTCVADHPYGFEWCINAPAIDRDGVVYGNGEDGVLYAIEQGGRRAQTIFLGEALGAAYTPLAIDRKGRIYTENVGKLFVVGE